MAPFSYTDYKDYLSDLIVKKLGHGAKAQLAEAAGCQRSFLSQVLNGSTHLTFEHAIGIAHFLGLSPDEKEYFFCLVGLGRSGSQELTGFYESKMKSLKARSMNLSKRLKASAPSETLAEYYSSWKFGAIHLLCTIPEYRTSKKISTKLKLPVPDVEHHLNRLKLMKLVDLIEGLWVCTKNQIHLPQNHFMTNVNHRNWREKNSIEGPKRSVENIQYSAVYSMSQEDFYRLKEMSFEFLEKTRGLVIESKEEELISFTLDCIRF